MNLDDEIEEIKETAQEVAVKAKRFTLRAAMGLVVLLLLVATGIYVYKYLNCYYIIKGSGYGTYYSLLEGCKAIKSDGRRFPIKMMREFAD